MSDQVPSRRAGVLIDTNLLVRLARLNDPQQPTAERALGNLAAAGRPSFRRYEGVAVLDPAELAAG